MLFLFCFVSFLLYCIAMVVLIVLNCIVFGLEACVKCTLFVFGFYVKQSRATAYSIQSCRVLLCYYSKWLQVFGVKTFNLNPIVNQK